MAREPSPQPPPAPPPGIALTEREPLARHTYLRIGGPARYFATPDTLEDVERLAAWARAAALPLLPLGGGSNLLVAGEGVRALVLSLRAACGTVDFDGPRVTAGAAVMLPALARAAAARGLGGMEFAIGIPGSVGGALMTNAGTGNGHSIGPLVQQVRILDVERARTLDAADLRFDYRTSSLRGTGAVVLSATLLLHERPRAEVEAEMRRLLAARAATQPTAEPNAGSIFRNPPEDYAGRLVEAAGCKGLARGAATVSDLHANFIVHDGTATAADVAALMFEVQQRVLRHGGVWLEPEIEWWGDGDPPTAFRGQPPGAA